jgi:hypothetical protein
MTDKGTSDITLGMSRQKLLGPMTLSLFYLCPMTLSFYFAFNAKRDLLPMKLSSFMNMSQRDCYAEMTSSWHKTA